MTYLLTKLCFSIFEVLIDLFIKMFNIFIEKPALFDSTKFEPILTTIQIVCAVLCLLSVMKDIIFRLSGIEGNIYDLNIGEYLVKIIFNIVGISLFPKIFTIMVDIALNVCGYINNQSKEIFTPSDVLETYKNVNLDTATLVLLILLIVIIFFGLKAVMTLAKTQVEILIANIIFPIVLIDFYKGSDKLNSFLSKTMGLFVNMCVQILLIYFGMTFMTKIPTSGLDSDFIWNILIATSCFMISSNPSIASDFITAPGGSSGSGGMQKAYYGARMLSAAKTFITKGAM